MGPGPNGFIYNTTPEPKAGDSYGREGGKMVGARGTGSFNVRLCLLGVSEAIPTKCHMTPKLELNKNSSKAC